jgi:hypothetical protein
MKAFSLITEHEAEITKQPGSTTTAIKRTERLYAAGSIQDVWDFIHTKEIFEDYGEGIVSLSEMAPAIHIIQTELQP